MLRYRLASATVLIPIIVGAVALGSWFFFALVTVALLLAGLEFYQMARRAGYRCHTPLGLVLIALLLFNTFAGTPWLREILAGLLVLSLVLAIFRVGEGWMIGWALTWAGGLYIGVLGSYFVLIRVLPNGALWTGIVLLAAWATDTAAFVAGTRWGRHGFFTHISPKKTWEGAVGGWVAAIVVMVGLGWIAGLEPLHSFFLGLGVGLAGTAGDLAESVLKRQVGAKDSGSIIPGHGGLLDRVDSLLFAAVFAYYYLVWIMRM